MFGSYFRGGENILFQLLGCQACSCRIYAIWQCSTGLSAYVVIDHWSTSCDSHTPVNDATQKRPARVTQLLYLKARIQHLLLKLVRQDVRIKIKRYLHAIVFPTWLYIYYTYVRLVEFTFCLLYNQFPFHAAVYSEMIILFVILSYGRPYRVSVSVVQP